MKNYLFFLLLLLPGATITGTPVQVPRDQFYHNSPDIRKHPGHYPFISHLTFRSIADWSIDQNTDWFDPALVKQGDIIYVNIWYLPWFEKQVHDRIQHPYILISLDVGAWLPSPHEIKKLIYDPKLAAWFGRNFVFSYHPKLIQTPMGQDLALFQLDPEVVKDLLNAHVKKPLPKEHLLYMNHYPRPYGDRDLIVKMFENEPYCFTRNHSNERFISVGRPQFYEDMLRSKFILSPLGLETDCVRTWEAFVLDCIPIVEHNFLDPLYDGLPIVKVHEWSDINASFLEKKYQELKHLGCDRAYFDYWYKVIKDVQTKVKNNDLSFSKLEATLFNDQDMEDLVTILKVKGLQKPNLIYKGALTTLRPLQLIDNAGFISRIHVYDPWLTQDQLNSWINYLEDFFLFMNRDRISILTSENQFNDIVKSNRSTPIFLDFTYFRHSLLVGDINNRFFKRSALKRDLNDLYRQVASGTLVFGNMSQNEYVKEVLEFFSKENNIGIEKKHNFWFFVKK